MYLSDDVWFLKVSYIVSFVKLFIAFYSLTKVGTRCLANLSRFELICLHLTCKKRAGILSKKFCW